MLNSLSINNIALITKLTTDFDEKLNIFSGETGAGKSIIIDAINFMLGAKTNKSLIRNGEEFALVEGAFDISGRQDIEEILLDLGIETDETLIISRQMNLKGKNTIRVNGKIVSLSMLRGISRMLVDVHGQSEHFTLAKIATHIDLLDKFGKNEIKNFKNEYIFAYDELQKLYKELNSFGGSDAERAHLIDLYNFQITEIEEANLTLDEEEQLNERFRLITNAEKIATSLEETLKALSVENGGIFSLSIASNELNSISHLNEQFPELVNRINSIRYECEDIESTLSDIQTELNFDDREADRVADRLELIKRLERKYGANITSIFEYLERTKKEYDKLTKSEEEISRINEGIEKAKIKTNDYAKKLTNVRKVVAKQFEELILKELSDLGIENANFEVYFKETNGVLTRNGSDDVEFMFSANLGQPLKPLVKVISGGEMSRFMLALKSITAELDNIDTMIFDEIDTGISGKIAHVVAEKFINLSRNHQVIVITHLPQICATGDKNLLIAKNIIDEHTETTINVLSKDEKIVEVARLSGSKELNEITKNHAIELIDYYDKLKVD